MNAIYSRTQADAEAEVVELNRQLKQASAEISWLKRECERVERDVELGRNVEASLRRELDDERRWHLHTTARVKALEARLEHINAIASGHAVVEGAEDSPP